MTKQFRGDLVLAVGAAMVASIVALTSTHLSYRDGWDLAPLRSMRTTLLLFFVGLGCGPVVAAIVLGRMVLPAQQNRLFKFWRLSLGGVLLVGFPTLFLHLREANVPAEIRGSRDRLRQNLDLDGLRRWSMALVPDETNPVPMGEVFWPSLPESATRARPRFLELPATLSSEIGTNVSVYVVQNPAEGRYVEVVRNPIALVIGSPSFRQQTNPNFTLELGPGVYLTRSTR